MIRSKLIRLFHPLIILAASLMLLPVAANPQSTSSDNLSIGARLRLLEDREAIRELLHHYIELNESRDWLAYSKLFAPDGELVMSSRTLQGPNAIYSLLEENFGKDKIGPDSFLYHASHLLTNIEISINGDTATATSRWSLLIPGAGGGNPQVMQAGKYHDALVRVGDAWKFKQRIIETNLPVPVGQ
jgi:hypothetical protein